MDFLQGLQKFDSILEETEESCQELINGWADPPEVQAHGSFFSLSASSGSESGVPDQRGSPRLGTKGPGSVVGPVVFIGKNRKIWEGERNSNIRRELERPN